jgi:hypothetical protein
LKGGFISNFTQNSNSGIMTLQSTAATDLEVNLLGTGAPNVHNYTTFNQQALGFGGGV